MITAIKKVYFSPTGTTKKIVDSIIEDIECLSVMNIDLTNPTDRLLQIECSSAELLVIGVPIYYGRVPQTVIERLKHLKGANTRAVIIGVYGNAKIDDALLELKDLVEKIGFVVIAGAAFIGEHTFSTEEKPIAEGRPDTNDLLTAKAFSKIINDKLAELHGNNESNELFLPGNTPYKQYTTLQIKVPEVDRSKCIHCNACYDLSPTGAISSDEKECIACLACVKSCPESARNHNSQLINDATDKLFNNFKFRKEPELYI